MSRCDRYALLTALALAASASLTQAGNRIGNGGNAVVCQDAKGKVRSAELLDFYEAELPSAASTKAAPKTAQDEKAIARDRLAGLQKVHPDLARQFQTRLAEISSELQFGEGVALQPIDDSKHLFTPRDPKCAVRQLAIRRSEPMPREKRFLVDQDTWKLLSPTARAGLLTHEIVYEYFSKLGETDSRKARYFNARLYNGAIAKMSAPEYWEMLQKLKLAMYP